MQSVNCEESKKPQTRAERVAAAKVARCADVRPQVAKLIKKVINENASTWKELAKR
jgi:hypothetical protein